MLYLSQTPNSVRYDEEALSECLDYKFALPVEVGRLEK